MYILSLFFKCFRYIFKSYPQVNFFCDLKCYFFSVDKKELLCLMTQKTIIVKYLTELKENCCFVWRVAFVWLLCTTWYHWLKLTFWQTNRENIKLYKINILFIIDRFIKKNYNKTWKNQNVCQKVRFVNACLWFTKATQKPHSIFDKLCGLYVLAFCGIDLLKIN